MGRCANLVSLDLADLGQIGDVADPAVRDEDVVVDQTGDGHPAVDVLEQVQQLGRLRFIFTNDFFHETISRTRECFFTAKLRSSRFHSPKTSLG